MSTFQQHTAAGHHHAQSERLALAFGFALAAGALILFAWLAEAMLRGNIAHFDSFVRSDAHALATPRLTTAMKVVTLLGSSLVLGPTCALVLVIYYIRREYHILRTLAAVFGGALALELILKAAFHRPRPVPFFDLAAPASYSFPSGHALVSLCVLAGLAMVISSRVSRAAIQIATWLASLLLVLAIGFSRVYLGVHYPSDVLAGYAAGTVWLMTIRIVDNLHFQHVRRERCAAQPVQK